jgi:serine/threonine protein phosphatase PrpC
LRRASERRSLEKSLGPEEMLVTIATQPSLTDDRPSMAEIDVCGMTHPGLARATNADHFLVASFHRTLRVHATSLGEALGPQETQNRGFLLLVADGVGGAADAGEGAARAVATVAQHLLHDSEICSNLVADRRDYAVDHLRQSVTRAHQMLVEAGTSDEAAHRATTLTMWAAFWPFAFVLHVGDSRLYRFRNGALERLTTDQTVAQMLVDAGTLSADAAERSQLKHVLWSAVGSAEVVPEVIVTDAARGGVVLLCTDGLTKHVTDAEIASHMSRHTPAEKTCKALVDLALSRGGTDNVTVVMARTREPDDA